MLQTSQTARNSGELVVADGQKLQGRWCEEARNFHDFVVVKIELFEFFATGEEVRNARDAIPTSTEKLQIWDKCNVIG